MAVFLERLKNDLPLRIHGDSEQTRDFIYVKDFVQANIAAIERGNQEKIQVSTAKRTSVNQLIKILEQIHGTQIETIHTNARPGDIKYSCLTNKKAKELLQCKN